MPARIVDLRAYVDARTLRSPGCWLWQGSRIKSGYGTVSQRAVRGGKARGVYVHRLAYEWHHGPIGAGLVVRHTCDNPPCINPAHLTVGTHADNARDKMERGRHQYQVGWRSRLPGSLMNAAPVTHCKRGHEFTPENTRQQVGGRLCLECRRMRNRRHKATARSRRVR